MDNMNQLTFTIMKKFQTHSYMDTVIDHPDNKRYGYNEKVEHSKLAHVCSQKLTVWTLTQPYRIETHEI